MKKVRAALIGCGSISRFHVDAILEAQGTLVYACDLNLDAAKVVAAKTGAKAIADYHQILGDKSVDVAHIVVDSKLHKEISLKFLEAGKHVICEKTLSENPEDSLEIVKYANSKELMLFTSYMKRYILAVEKAKELMGELGSLISARFFTRQPWGNLWEGATDNPFFGVGPDGVSEVVKRYGGGILHCGGSHILDLINFLVGLPQSVNATQIRPDYLDYDLKTAATFMINGLDVQFEALAHPLNHIGLLNDGWDEGFEIVGTKGKIVWQSSVWDDVASKSSILTHYREDGQQVTYTYAPQSPFSRAISAFYKDIVNGEQVSQSPWSGYHVDEMIAKIGLSVAHERAVRFEW